VGLYIGGSGLGAMGGRLITGMACSAWFPQRMPSPG
jgi:hypothetical protein